MDSKKDWKSNRLANSKPTDNGDNLRDPTADQVSLDDKSANSVSADSSSRARRFSTSMRIDDFGKLLRLLDSALPESVRAKIFAGLVDAILGDESFIRGIADRNLPKEAAGFLISSAETTRREVLRIVSREIRNFLHTVDISGELAKIMTSMLFEVKISVGFVPSQRKQGEDKLSVTVEETLPESRDDGLSQDLKTVNEVDLEETKSALRKLINGLRGGNSADEDDEIYSDETIPPSETSGDSRRGRATKGGRSSSLRAYTGLLWNLVNDRLIQPSLQQDEENETLAKFEEE